METTKVMMIALSSILMGIALLSSSGLCATVLIDDFSTQLKNHSTVHIGDIIIFKHKDRYGLYIFRSRRAFELCNFSQAVLLTTNSSSSYTWHPSRLGYFYFSFSNTIEDKSCQKLAINVTPQPTSTSAATPAPSPTSEGLSASPESPTPTYPWPFTPREKVFAPQGSAAEMSPSVSIPSDKMPFIDSNPAVPLPTNEVDSATTIIQSLPTPASSTTETTTGGATSHASSQGGIGGVMSLLVVTLISSVAAVTFLLVL